MPKKNRPEVTVACGLLGENETTAVEDPAASANPVTAKTPALARARTMAGSLRMGVPRFVWVR